jgi:hypothetical protein
MIVTKETPENGTRERKKVDPSPPSVKIMRLLSGLSPEQATEELLVAGYLLKLPDRGSLVDRVARLETRLSAVERR